MIAAAIQAADLGAVSHLLTVVDPWEATAGLVHLAVRPPLAPEATLRRLAELLLHAGADPNHHEALYHACEHTHHAILEPILAAPALERPWLSHCLLRKLDFADLRGVEKMLDAGADPNLRSRQGDREMSLHHAIRRGRDAATIALLLTRGARPDIINIHNHTARRQAIRFGRSDFGAAVPEATALDHWLFQLWHRPAAGPPPSPLGKQDFRLLPEAAGMRHHGAVANMLAAGFPVDSVTHDDLRSIDFAAYHRDEPLAALLIAHGATGEQYQAALQWLAGDSEG
jgi:ankyrin repeat protein